MNNAIKTEIEQSERTTSIVRSAHTVSAIKATAWALGYDVDVDIDGGTIYGWTYDTNPGEMDWRLVPAGTVVR